MKIVIVGDGKVGQALTGRLSEEGHDVVVIDNSPDALRSSVEIYDVMGISGNGASYAVQKEAGVEEGKVFPHNLRHLFAVTYYNVEKDICHLADLLGHSNVNTTRIYTLISCEMQERRLEGLGLVLADKNTA